MGFTTSTNSKTQTHCTGCRRLFDSYVTFCCHGFNVWCPLHDFFKPYHVEYNFWFRGHDLPFVFTSLWGIWSLVEKLSFLLFLIHLYIQQFYIREKSFGINQTPNMVNNTILYADFTWAPTCQFQSLRNFSVVSKS